MPSSQYYQVVEEGGAKATVLRIFLLAVRLRREIHRCERYNQ